MPIHNAVLLDGQGRPSALGLQLAGPILRVEVSLHPQLIQLLRTQGQPVPGPVTGSGLIDTGAGVTAVDRQVLTQLQIPPVGTVQVGTAGGPQQQQVFPASIRFPETAFPGVTFASVIGADLTGQGIVALVGRDVLRHCVLIYNGGLGQFIMCV